MKIDIDLNDVQIMLMAYAQRHGMTEAQVHEELLLCYRTPLQNEFEVRLSNLLEAMQLYKEALAQGDLLVAKCGLLYAELYAGLLTSSFEALNKDLRTALVMDRSPIPEDYQIPEYYGFSQK